MEMEEDYIFKTTHRERFLKCKWTGVLQIGKCEHCGSILLKCTRYGGLCSSKNCKEGTIKERWRMIGELEEEIGRTLEKLSETPYMDSKGEFPAVDYMKLWKKHRVLKDISTKMQIWVDKYND